jgi:hypothetical protein
MTDLSPSYGVPYMNKTRRGKNPMDILQQIVDDNPGLSDEEVRNAFADKVQEDPDLTRMCLKAYCVNLQTSLRRVQPPEVAEQQREKRAEQQEEREAAKVAQETKVREAIVKTVDRLTETIFTLTFGEVARLAKASPQLAKIAEMGEPHQRISEVLTLAQLQEMLPK